VGLRENLWRDDLSQVELKNPLSVSPYTSVRETIELMRSERSGCILVCDGPALVGIFTERDFIKRVAAPGADLDAPVSEHMTPDPVTACRTDLVGSVIRTMYRGHYRHLPVVDRSGRPLGIVSVKGIAQYLVDFFPQAVYNLPPRPQQAQEAREGA
jgi:CBS domain-containing protein